MARTVLLLGATGLVGRELLDLLLADETVSRVLALTRRPVARPSPKLDARVADLGALESQEGLLAVDQVFCALGTTIAVAGSRDAFRRVDHDWPLSAARVARSLGARHYLLVSAVDANPRSLFFYNRVKGELEQALAALGYLSLTIARPSLILGPREERRPGEEWAKRLDWLLPPKYKVIEARTLARALAEAAREDAPGVRVLESREMRARHR
jgi:uncharacterized protein YbjT (DUF2867 family)